MVMTLYIFGVASVKEFALPLMVGIIAGCWSSVCIAGPLWHLLRTKIKSAKDDDVSDKAGSGSNGNGGNGSGGNSGQSSSKKKGSSNLSKKERKLQKQKEIEERNKAKIVV